MQRIRSREHTLHRVWLIQVFDAVHQLLQEVRARVDRDNVVLSFRRLLKLLAEEGSPFRLVVRRLVEDGATRSLRSA